MQLEKNITKFKRRKLKGKKAVQDKNGTKLVGSGQVNVICWFQTKKWGTIIKPDVMAFCEEEKKERKREGKVRWEKQNKKGKRKKMKRKKETREREGKQWKKKRKRKRKNEEAKEKRKE